MSVPNSDSNTADITLADLPEGTVSDAAKTVAYSALIMTGCTLLGVFASCAIKKAFNY